jgi:hypothetical protein
MRSGKHGKINMNKGQRKQAAAALGRLGGKARAKRLTPEQRSAEAKRAAEARWKAKQKGQSQ